MKLYFLFLLMILTKLSISFAGDERRLMILLDPEDYEIDEKESSACLRELLKGINEQCSPIVMSKSIWNNFTQRRRAMEEIIISKEEKGYLQKLYDWWKNKKLEQKEVPQLHQAINNINNILLEVQKDINAAGDMVRFDNQGNLQKIEGALESKLKSHIKSIAAIEAMVTRSEMREIADDFVCYLTPFDEKDWIIKLHENDLVILIPYRYYEQCKQSQTEKFKTIAQKFITLQQTSLTLDELILGIKLNHLKTMDKPLDGTNDVPSVFSVKAFNDIFITRSDLNLLTLKSKASPNTPDLDIYEQLLHPWYFYMIGHGTPGTKIVGIPLMEFKEVLQFFNIQIFTRFLFYESCLSGGANAQEVFEYAQTSGREIAENAVQWIQEEFNYTIAGGTLLDALTFIPAFYFKFLSIKWQRGRIVVMPGQIQKTRVCRFFERLSVYFGDSVSTRQESSISNIINEIHPFKFKEAMYRYYNTPMIRFAHTPWFFVDDADKEVMHITPIKVKIAIANKQPIIIKNKKIVFLNDPYIPLTLKVEGEIPTFLFGVAGGVNIHIDGIKVDTTLKGTISAFVKTFLRINYFGYSKTCTIKKLSFGEQADQMFQHILIRNATESVAYAERMDGAFYILKKSEGEKSVEEIIIKEESIQPEQMEKLKLYADEYKQLAPIEDVFAPTPEIEEGIEYQSLEEYSAEPIAKLLQRRLEARKQAELRKKFFEQAWRQYMQKKQQEPQAKLKIEEVD